MTFADLIVPNWTRESDSITQNSTRQSVSDGVSGK